MRPEIKPEWLVVAVNRPSSLVAVLTALEEAAHLVSVGRTIKINWWGYGLEIFLFAIFQDIEGLMFKIEILGEDTLKAIVKVVDPIVIFVARGST